MQPYKQETLYHFTYNLDTRVVEHDDSIVKIYGLKKYYENMPYGFAEEFVNVEDRDAYIGIYEKIMRGDRFATCDFRAEDPELWSRVSLYRENMESNIVEGFVQNVSDFYNYIIKQSNERNLERIRRIALEQDYTQLVTAVKDTYAMVLLGNVTKDTCHLIGRASDEGRLTEEGSFDEMVEFASQKAPREFQQGYYEHFSREALIKAHAEGKKDVYWEYQYTTPQDKTIWLSTHVLLMIDADSKDLLSIALSQNIDERKQKEQTRRKKELEALQLLTAIGQTHDMIISVNLSQNSYSIINIKQFPELENYLPSDLDGLLAFQCQTSVAEEFRAKFADIFNRPAMLDAYAKGEKTIYLEYQAYGSSGELLWYCTNTMFVEDTVTGDITAITISQNIDERKQKEFEIEKFRVEKEMEALQLTSAVKSAFDVVVSINLTKRTYKLMSGNDYYRKNIPLSGELDKLIWWVYEHITDEFREECRTIFDRNNIEKTKGKGNYISFEHKNIEADGKEHWVVTDIMLDENPYSDDTLAIVTRRNIDERKNKEQEQMRLLSDALKLAENASRAKSDFLSRMSHDIRTPMNAVIGYATIAASHIDEKERVQDSLKKILSSGEHLQGLINDVLDMSRIEAGKESLNVIRTSVSEMIRTVLPMIHSYIEQKQIALYVDTIDVTNEYVYADAQKMRQLLLNILGNAAKFTCDGGSISVKIKQMPSRNDGYATYTFLIRDTGIGMSREFKEHIFETFSQERTSTNSKQLGTGLGMAIAKSYVDMMGGTISVESEIGKGTEFAVKLEFKLQDDVKPDARLEQLKGYRALVVDDDFQSCESVVHLLQDIGMRADFTTTGKEALFRTKMAYGDGDSYFAYIIDWIMPDMNGIELVRQIRKIIGDEIPIIILTAYYWGDIEQEAREAGVTAFCTKPLFTSDLANVFLRHEAEPEKTVNFENEHILLVEDNELNREIAKFMLEEIGFVVDIACDGQDAVNAMNDAEDGKYDYVLMDVQMPIMDGIESTKIIRKSDRQYLREIPIIALTANAFTEDADRCLAAGMNAHLAKPFKIEDIIDTLNSFKSKEGK